MNFEVGKIREEIGKKVWVIQTKEGKVIDKFSSKALANKYKKKYEEDYFQELELVRDNKYRDKLKEKLKK